MVDADPSGSPDRKGAANILVQDGHAGSLELWRLDPHEHPVLEAPTASAVRVFSPATLSRHHSALDIFCQLVNFNHFTHCGLEPLDDRHTHGATDPAVSL